MTHFAAIVDEERKLVENKLHAYNFIENMGLVIASLNMVMCEWHFLKLQWKTMRTFGLTSTQGIAFGEPALNLSSLLENLGFQPGFSYKNQIFRCFLELRFLKSDFC